MTISSTGNATDFGDMSVTAQDRAGLSDATRGVFGGGKNDTTDVIDYITIASTGNASDFGDLLAASYSMGGAAGITRGLFLGGFTPSVPERSAVIQFITIQSTGNATDFGDLTVGRNGGAACSDSHGGLT